jgi:hypothetical protein
MNPVSQRVKTTNMLWQQSHGIVVRFENKRREIDTKTLVFGEEKA